MQIIVRGCAGSMAQGAKTTCFSVGQNALIDAGTGLHHMGEDELAAIHQVFITHAHLDHIVGLTTLTDMVSFGHRHGHRGDLRIYGVPEVLDAIQRNLFNEMVWPDFARLPNDQEPLVKFCPMQVGEEVQIVPDTVVQMVSANHMVPACGYLVKRNAAGWLFTGDTCSNPSLWQALNAQQESMQLRWVVADCAFSNESQGFAKECGHFTAADLANDLTNLEHQGVTLYLSHLKPSIYNKVNQEAAQLQQVMQARGGSVTLLQEGQIFNL